VVKIAGSTAFSDVFVLALFFGALMFFGVGRLALANPDEARYAEIPREMALRGDWVTPRLNDTPYFEKPPLVYWLVGASRALLGPGEFAVRLTPAFFGVGGILLTYGATRRLFGREAGLAAGVVRREGERYVLTKVGACILTDEITGVNLEVVQHCCFQASFYLEDSIREAKPVGLHKVFGDWETIYPALTRLPTAARDSWFKWDHYFSDAAFPEALPLVFELAGMVEDRHLHVRRIRGALDGELAGVAADVE